MSNSYYNDLAGAGSELFNRDDTPNAPPTAAERIRGLLGALVLAVYYALLIGGQYFFDGTSEFYRSLNLFSGAGDPDPLVRIVSCVVFFYGVSRISKFLLSRFALSKVSSRKMGRALMGLLGSLIQYACAIAAALMVLNTLGVDTMEIVAGLGILGLIIGLGAEELVADILAGMFIVFERLYDVGDIIVVDEFRGTVKEVGIRTTQIEDIGGNVLVVRNSEIGSFINMTDKLSVANCDVQIGYGEDLEKVEGIFKEGLPAMGAAIPEVKEGPFYIGVSGMTEAGLALTFAARCEEGYKYIVERAMYRQLKLLFDRNEIEIVGGTPEEEG
ncbi:MAG: mechanosensitive ion channel family protein [Oscillibacter sp.]|nr:mechanosensitive ion channel family protein [Oscillibacter sp.]